MRAACIAIAAIAYLLACWAPQILWPGASAQETATVNPEVRAGRFVLVDASGNDVAVLECAHDGGAELRLGPGGVAATVLISSSGSGPTVRVHAPIGGDDVAVAELRPGGLYAADETQVDGRWQRGVGWIEVGGALAPEVQLSTSSGARASLGIGRLHLCMPSADSDAGERPYAEAVIQDTGVTLSRRGRVRARVGVASSMDAVSGDREQMGGATTIDGAFVSYDEDGTVLWMEPR